MKIMRRVRFDLLAASLLLFATSCSPSNDEVKDIVSSYLASISEEGSTMVLNIEKTDKLIYSGAYVEKQDAHTSYAYLFTAIIKNGEVSQFFKDTDDAKVMVISVKPEAMLKSEDEITPNDVRYEIKKDYDKRIRRQGSGGREEGIK